MRYAAVLLALTLGCGAAQPLPLRIDPAAAVAARPHLPGVRVGVRRVTDAREERDAVGQHRDGFLRVRAYRYVSPRPLVDEVRGVLAVAVAESGARIVDGEADLLIDVDVLELSVTTDAPLAGEETFGEVALHVTLADSRGHVLTARTYDERFANERDEDPGMLGDAVHRALSRALATVARGR